MSSTKVAQFDLISIFWLRTDTEKNSWALGPISKAFGDPWDLPEPSRDRPKLQIKIKKIEKFVNSCQYFRL